MVFRAVIAVSLLFPMIGTLLLEMGWYGPDIDQQGHPNGATLALATYSIVVLLTAWLAERRGIFKSFGAGKACSSASISNLALVAIMAPMAGFILFGAGGINTILGHLGSGTFRVGLTSTTGAPSYLILKYYAPALFAYVTLTSANRGALLSTQTIIAAALLSLIALSFGYKTSIVMAMLPAATLLTWKSSARTAAKLALAASFLTVVSYRLLATSDFQSTFDAIFSRLFLWHGGVPWKVWGMYVSGIPFPSYVNTLPSALSDRLFTFLTGITRTDETAWVLSHFNLMATSIAGYTPSYIVQHGHNNAANAFSEGLIACGAAGALTVAILAGLLINALYHFIENRLTAKDFAAASVAACYLFYALMSWLIGGGLAEIIHSSVIFGMLSGYLLLRLVPTTFSISRAQYEASRTGL